MGAPTPPNLQPVLFPQPLARGRRRWLFVFPLAAGLAVAGLWPPSSSDSAEDSESVAPASPAMQAKPAAAAVPDAGDRAPRASEPAMADLLLSRGVGAYEDLAYDSAAMLLRRALGRRGPDSLDAPRRARALTYLAAAEIYRGRRDSSVAAFRRLLQESPRRIPDTLVFPPRVMSVYKGVRSSLHGVARIRSTASGVDLIVVAFTPHRLGVGVRVHDGEPLRELFDGIVSDSVVVPWDGRKEDGTMAPSGAYDFVLIAFGPKGDVAKAVRFPVVLDHADTTRPARPRSVDSPLLPLTRLGDAVQPLLQPPQ